MSLRLGALLVSGPSHRFDRNDFCLLLAFVFQFTWRWTSRGWDIGQSLDQFLMQFDALRHQSVLIVRQGNKFEHMHEIGLALNKLLFQGILGPVKWAAGTGHAMRALRPEWVGAKSMSEIVVFPRLTARSRTRKHCFLVQEHFNGRQILFQVPCLDHFAGKLGGIDEKIALCRRKVFVPQILFDLKNGKGFPGIVQHRSDGRPRPVTGDISPTILLWNTCFSTQEWDQRFVNVVFPDTLSSIGKQEPNTFTCFAINLTFLILGPDLLPLLDACSDQRVNWLGVGGRGFVHRNVEKAGCILWKHLSRFWDHHIFILPTYTPDA